MNSTVFFDGWAALARILVVGMTAMRRERIAEDVLAAVRRGGILSLEDVHAGILETSGSISVMEHAGGPARGSVTTPGRLHLNIEGES